ncbi:MAG: DUF58 domain-containing protein [Alphaproteobacteria bacterium]
MTKTESQLRLRHSAERAGGALPPLLVAAERVASTVIQGVHGRRRVGLGETFWQFRRYETGDSMRSIDWRQSAKSQLLFVRETEWAAAQSLWLWRDASPSMRWRSHRSLPEKRERAELLMLALSSMLVRAGERVALLDGNMRPASGKAAIDRLALELLGASGAATTPADVPAFHPIPRHAHTVWFSDFLAPLEKIDAMVRQYATRNVNGFLLQVLDPAEEGLPFNGRTRFEGLENEGRVLVKRVENVRADYRQRLDRHIAGLRDIARAAGWRYALHRTDLPPEKALLAMFVALSEPKE